ncbi:MAG TPA: S1C family serine protease [Acetobacteraceae bacterium]
MRKNNLGSLARFSEELAAIVGDAAPVMGAVRLGSGHGHVSGFIWKPGLLVTSGRATGKHGVVLADGLSVRAQPVDGSEDGRIAAFRVSLPSPEPTPLRQSENPVRTGTLVVALGAGPDGSPTARLVMVHRTGADGVRLDGPLDMAAEGGPVLDAEGRLLGMAVAASDGACALLEVATIARALAPPRPGWLGVAFQPTLVPLGLREEAGQDSARLVVRVIRGGPAEGSGLAVGDIVLTLDGIGMTGTGTLRGFLASARPGREITARLVRGGRIETTRLTVQADPNPHW